MVKIMKKDLVTWIVATLLVAGCGCADKKLNNNAKDEIIKPNINENVIKNQELEGFRFTNTSLVYANG